MLRQFWERLLVLFSTPTTTRKDDWLSILNALNLSANTTDPMCHPQGPTWSYLGLERNFPPRTDWLLASLVPIAGRYLLQHTYALYNIVWCIRPNHSTRIPLTAVVLLMKSWFIAGNGLGDYSASDVFATGFSLSSLEFDASSRLAFSSVTYSSQLAVHILVN